MKQKILFVEYPKCTTCKKAKEFLEKHGVDYIDRNIKDEKPLTVFSYSMEGGTFTPAGDAFAPKDHTWVGAKIGLYAVSSEKTETEQKTKTDRGSVLIKKIGIV